MNIQPVTALFDLGRATIDGRLQETYIDWLRKAIAAFPNVIVFHDSTLPRVFISEYKSTIFLELGMGDLLASEQPRIKEILRDKAQNSLSDLVYKLPEYGFVIHSKFDFLKRACSIVDSEGLLWIDAGLSRFSNWTNCEINLNNLVFPLDTSEVCIDVRNLIKQLILNKTFRIRKLDIVGSSARIIGAATIYVPSSKINLFVDSARDLRKQWLADSKWDTEQVALFELLPKIKPRLIPEFQGNHLSMIQNRGYVHNKFISLFNFVFYKFLFL